ncbi:NAD(P)H-dependent oxidoreductase [Deinococcus cellulosilyticus]|uniref:NAD(P)H dehydrogenase n=1 Tax=Deinococcus cellulosilyticus (strain DSM 18568 / NBRC 106333 / KACC 11606 / 5516J-15) TaxID=1223518 RepID=A0A511N6D0_DEIC1|nr:NAD(P)H-dependent oxidoreductase [Deinococcus cellulosilyticus]GEM48405.1 NAD(P)H dehydrogenase [Deinococcus cellulosilyticus NBRC 106333 = KACC 11606]
MKTLILYAHPFETSFNHAVLEVVKGTLKSHQAEVVVRPLYQLNFQPIASPTDFEALTAGETRADVREEQDWVQWADGIILIYPVWWTGMPAILKGYFDRVFTPGFAYRYEDGIKHRLLQGKQGLIFSTTGATREACEKGMFEAMNRTVDEGIFQFSGIAVRGHHYMSNLPGSTAEEREKMLLEVEQKVTELFYPSVVSRSKGLTASGCF